jgi:hypothetical protein
MMATAGFGLRLSEVPSVHRIADMACGHRIPECPHGGPRERLA